MSSIKSVVISCAGIGSRLGLGLTKALLKINGRSLISLQLELFKDVEDLRIVVGFQANDIIEEVLKYRSDVTFIFNHRYFETKTGASLYLGAQHATERILAWDGDLLVHPNDVKMILEKAKIDYVAIDALVVENGTISYNGEFQIFTITGQNVTAMNGSLVKGVYVVRTSKSLVKVFVK